MHPLWIASSEVLVSGKELVERLDVTQYTATCDSCFGSSIGEHIRHCVQHFESFRGGVKTGEIDYDCRARGILIEKDPDEAVHVLEELIFWCRHHEDGKRHSGEVAVRLNLKDRSAESVPSSIERELQFLLSHTIHHFAIVAIMCQTLGVEVDSEFGVAPSTIRYRKGDRS